jgi:uncharacterized membrane protein YphA (DoxX/SURF4 family)
MKKIMGTIANFEDFSWNWMERNGISLLRISVGIIFFWFGILKFFPNISPAQDLAIRTISELTFGLISAKAIIITLASWEVAIGLGLISGKMLKATLVLLFLQMIGTFTPVFLFPNEVFTTIPLVPTIEGQYIIKNIVIISAGFTIGARFSKKKKL